jgi:uncharacterized protein YunC (DUF1805 family)
MRYLPILFILLVTTLSAGAPMDWSNLERERIELAAPLLIIKGESGFLACGYINAATCNKTGEACAIVNGVNNHDDMLEATISDVSVAAVALGVKVGMSGADALEILR